jgi:hypothetical protein
MWTWIICCRQRTKWRAVVKTEMKSQCLGMRGICGLSEETSAAEEGICSFGLVTKHLRLFAWTAYIVAVFRLKSQLLEQNIEGQAPRWPVQLTTTAASSFCSIHVSNCLMCEEHDKLHDQVTTTFRRELGFVSSWEHEYIRTYNTAL